MTGYTVRPAQTVDMAAAPDVLVAIVAATRRAVAERRQQVSEDELERRVAASRRPAGSQFVERLGRSEGVNIIAECKRRSPLKGVLRSAYDPAAIGRGYAAAGAAALSVLTEPAFFDGSLEHLAALRSAVDVPLLRKDFIIDRYQLLEACCAGADAVLLIVSVLGVAELRQLHQDADRLGLAPLVEVHTARELDTALDVGARVIGVNNRNLKTQAVDTEASARLLDTIPDQCVAVAESGLKTGSDVARLRRAGFDAFLIGEAFMTASEPGDALGQLLADAAAAGMGSAGAGRAE